MILVTGCTGYLGFHICEYLKTKKIPFYGIDNFSRSSQKNIIDKEKFLKIDISSKHLPKLLEQKKIHTVIHAAAYSFPPESEDKKKYITKTTYKKLKSLLIIVMKSRSKNLFFFQAQTFMILIQIKLYLSKKLKNYFQKIIMGKPNLL